ncbi:hypothetical protein ACEU6E_09645 [Halorutilales archaeon Cl-col2-1]
MFDRLLDIFGSEEDQALETTYSDAADDFRTLREDDIKKAKDEYARLRDEIEDTLVRLDDELAEMQGQSYDESVIEDVMQNVLRQRRGLIDSVDVSDSASEDGTRPSPRPRDLRAELADFIDGFRDMNRKEMAVINEVDLPEGFYSRLEEIEEYYEKLGELVESEFSAVETYESLDDAVERRTSLIDEAEELRGEIDDLGIEEDEDEIQSRRQRIDELEGSEDWEDLQELRQDLQDLRDEIDAETSALSKAASDANRGLKKLLYEAENSDLSFASNVDTRVLQRLRDSEVSDLLDIQPATVEETVESLRRDLEDGFGSDVLGEKGTQKLIDALSVFENFSETVETIESARERADEIEERIEDHEVREERRRLEDEIENLERTVERKRETRESLRDRVDEKHDEIAEVEDRIRNILESEADREVVLEDEYTDGDREE